MKKKMILPIILLVGFIIVMILVITNNITAFDEAVYNFLISKRCSGLDFYFTNVTRLGNTITIVIAMSILVIVLKDIYRIIAVAGVVSTVGMNQIVKFIVRRPRPDHLRLIKQGGFSFPSGHSMVSIALYGFLIYFINKKIKNKILKIILTILLVIIIISIGLSRIYVGVHYPSDVLGGYLFALAILITTIILCHHFGGIKNDKDGCK
jgi:undecaprenyl-diphosphatase